MTDLRSLHGRFFRQLSRLEKFDDLELDQGRQGRGSSMSWYFL